MTLLFSFLALLLSLCHCNFKLYSFEICIVKLVHAHASTTFITNNIIILVANTHFCDHVHICTLPNNTYFIVSAVLNHPKIKKIYFLLLFIGTI